MLHDSMIAAIRTGIAALVGTVVSYLVSSGFDLDSGFTLGLITVLTVFCIASYNWLVIILEKKVHPMFGILLGVPKAPKYSTE